jgi:hypothetical protein
VNKARIAAPRAAIVRRGQLYTPEIIVWHQRILIAAVTALTTAASLGVTWRVPEDVPTIQVALDSLTDGDTVLVDTGTYHEALQARNRTFVLLGVASPDSQRPVVDPTSLEGSRHLACLTLPPLSRAVIRDFIFRNGWDMFPRDHFDDVGGIANEASDLRIEHCTFDSTYKGVECAVGSAGTLTVSDCEFILNSRGCVRDRRPSRTSIFNCDFSANGDRALWLSDSALVENCQFHDMHNSGEWIWLEGYGNTVRGCTFGPTITPEYDIIWSHRLKSCTFEQNTFQDTEVYGAVFWFNGAANDTPHIGVNDTTCFRENVFRQNHAVQALQSGAGILLAEQQDSLVSQRVLITDNLFDSCWAASSSGFGSIKMGACNNWLEHNTFIGPNIPMPSVRYAQVDTMLIPNASIHDCSFNNTGLALWASWFLFSLNAERNWWGDSTGPYHSQFNPLGMGDEVIGPVDFDPWLLAPPDSDSTDASSVPFPPVPEDLRLDCYPNPFNATATLHLIVNQPGVYDVELYNTLGQRALHVWSGSIAHEKQITLNARALPSGLYFLRANGQEGNRVALSKIVLLK